MDDRISPACHRAFARGRSFEGRVVVMRMETPDRATTAVSAPPSARAVHTDHRPWVLSRPWFADRHPLE